MKRAKTTQTKRATLTKPSSHSRITVYIKPERKEQMLLLAKSWGTSLTKTLEMATVLCKDISLEELRQSVPAEELNVKRSPGRPPSSNNKPDAEKQLDKIDK